MPTRAPRDQELGDRPTEAVEVPDEGRRQPEQRVARHVRPELIQMGIQLIEPRDLGFVFLNALFVGRHRSGG